MFLEIRDCDLDDYETISAVEIYEKCVIRYMSDDAPNITIGEMHTEIAEFMAELTKAYYESERMAERANNRMEYLRNNMSSPEIRHYAEPFGGVQNEIDTNH